MIWILPYSAWDCLWLAPLALCLDLCLGDPAWIPWRHPVCLIGSFLNWQEKVVRRLSASVSSRAAKARVEKILGFLAVAATASAAFIVVLTLIKIPMAGVFFAIYFAWAGLAFGCLLETGQTVMARLDTGDINLAREGVSWLVSRDTSQLDLPMLRKTLADTLSENFTDAFLAPYFWLLLAGPAGLWLYKAISTMDSQWGYLTPQWRHAGFAAAKSDDILAYIPGRLAPLALGLAHWLFGKRKIWRGFWPGWRVVAHDAAGMPSPNSGWPMAACAWLCHGPMAGPSVYFGELVPKAWLGPPGAKPWDNAKLAALCQLMFYAAICGGFALWLICALALYII